MLGARRATSVCRERARRARLARTVAQPRRPALPCPPPAPPASSQSRRPASKTREEPRDRGCARRCGHGVLTQGLGMDTPEPVPAPDFKGSAMFCTSSSLLLSQHTHNHSPRWQPATKPARCCGADWSSAPSVSCACEGSWWCPAGMFPKTNKKNNNVTPTQALWLKRKQERAQQERCCGWGTAGAARAAGPLVAGQPGPQLSLACSKTCSSPSCRQEGGEETGLEAAGLPSAHEAQPRTLPPLSSAPAAPACARTLCPLPFIPPTTGFPCS